VPKPFGPASGLRPRLWFGSANEEVDMEGLGRQVCGSDIALRKTYDRTDWKL
jgi:hypothetical protein